MLFRSATPPARAKRIRAYVARWLIVLPAIALCAKDHPSLEEVAAARYSPQTAMLAAELTELMNQLQNVSTKRKLQQVNDFFNRRIQFQDDIVVWQEKDYWASPLEMMDKGAGDCEDFSIAKFAVLRKLGIANEKLRLTYVKAAIGGPGSRISQAHMVLSYYETATSMPLIMDNLVSRVRPANQRPDLVPVFGFNSEGLWVGGQTQASQYDPKARLSRWREVLVKINNEGLEPAALQ